MTAQPLAQPAAGHGPASPGGSVRRRLLVTLLTLVPVAALTWSLLEGLLRDGLDAADVALLTLYLPNTLWTGFAAATAVCGMLWAGSFVRRAAPPPAWAPRGRTAILVPARNEAVGDLQARVESLRAALATQRFGTTVDLFILSDSDDPWILRAEQNMALAFACGGDGMPPVYYRHRESNAGRKPGNIAEWVRRWGGGYAYMLVLDADSRMSADRIAALVAEMEARPDIGLIQTGVRLTGATSRFGRLLQTASRLYGAAFTAGIAGWSGTEGNYWGHNALIRVEAFAGAAGLPRLTGAPPFGGDVLSHDFVEAAWLRRGGWGVVIDPDAGGSAEGGPSSLAEFHKRDRRWCQGNLQHLGILGARGLHPVSRLHLLCGIFSYVAAPLWLGLVVAATLFGASGDLVLPLVGALVLILVQKLAGLAIWRRRRRSAVTTVARLSLAEIAVSSLLAPIVMVRQTLAVVSVLAGNDCGWKPPTGSARGADDMPWLEPAVGACLLLAVLPGAGGVWSAALILPIVLPLLAAPLITQVLDLPPGRWPAWLRLRPTADPEPAPALQAVQRYNHTSDA